MSWRTHATAGKPRRKRSLNKDGAPRKPPVDREGQEQIKLIRWLHGEKMRGTTVGGLYDVTYHVPNGGARHKATAAALKGQGVKAGVSDLVVMDARGGHHGLYLEFKATPPHHASLADSQRQWLARADARGYCTALARGHEQAKEVLREYASWTATGDWAGPGREPRLSLDTGTEWRRGDEHGECSTGGAGGSD